jgi:opacity protein-like surface antigen
MKTTYFVALTLLATLMGTGVQAQSRVMSDAGYYGEIAYTPIDVNDGLAGTSTPQAARFIVGKDLDANWAVEGMYTATASKDHRDGFNATINNYGIHIKPKVALTPDTLVFARVGVTRSDITASTGGARTGTDLSYGIGLQTNFTKSVYGQLDYMTYFDKDNTTAKGFSLSVGTRF